MKNYHRHIPFHGGHITWNSSEPPSGEMMAAFEKIRESVIKMEQASNPLIHEIQESLVSEIRSKFDQKLKQFILQNLNRLGYQFESDLKLIEFVKTRLTVVSFEEKDPWHQEIYLDFIDASNPGLFVGSFSTKANCFFDGKTMTFSIG